MTMSVANDRTRTDQTPAQVVYREILVEMLVPGSVFRELGLNDSEDQVIALGDSLANFGQLHPLIVRQRDDGKFEIITGYRRYLAALYAGVETLTCQVRSMSDQQ